MKAVDTKREALAATGLLADVSDRDINEIARLCDVIHVDAGMRLTMQDTPGRSASSSPPAPRRWRSTAT
jgi:hypothetical protein